MSGSVFRGDYVSVAVHEAGHAWFFERAGAQISRMQLYRNPLRGEVITAQEGPAAAYLAGLAATLLFLGEPLPRSAPDLRAALRDTSPNDLEYAEAARCACLNGWGIGANHLLEEFAYTVERLEVGMRAVKSIAAGLLEAPGWALDRAGVVAELERARSSPRRLKLVQPGGRVP